MEPGLLAAHFCCFHLSCLLHPVLQPFPTSPARCPRPAVQLEHRSKEFKQVGAPTQLVQLKPRRRLVAALVEMFFTCSLSFI
jgi:hypothetical protein